MPGDQGPHGDPWYFAGYFPFAWGIPSIFTNAVLGVGDMSNHTSPTAMSWYRNQPVPYPGHNETDIAFYLGPVAIASSGSSTHWISQADAGAVFFTGDNANYEGGASTADTNLHSNRTDQGPHISVTTLPALADLSAGGTRGGGFEGGTVFALGSNAKLYAWGRNFNGQTGQGHTTAMPTPVDVTPSGRVIVKVHAGGRHTLALDNTGRVWSAGNNDYGQIGRGTIGVQDTSWGEVVPPLGLTWIRIAAGPYASLLQASDGTVYGCGRGEQNELGRDVFLMPSSRTVTPTLLSGAMPPNIVEMMQNGLISWFRTATGELWAHGRFHDTGFSSLRLQSIAGGVGSPSTFAGTGTDPNRVPLDWLSASHPTYVVNSPETVTCKKLAYCSGFGTDTYGATDPWFAVINSNDHLMTWGNNTGGQRGDGSTTLPTNHDIFEDATNLDEVTLLTIADRMVYAVARGTITRYDHPFWSGADIKAYIFNIDTGSPPPSTWMDPSFDDSSWGSVVYIPEGDTLSPNTPPPGVDPLVWRTLSEPTWPQYPDTGRNWAYYRMRFTPPAETTADQIPGHFIYYDRQTFGAGPFAGWGRASSDNTDPTRIVGHYSAGIAGFHINGGPTIGFEAFAYRVNPGVTNVFATGPFPAPVSNVGTMPGGSIQYTFWEMSICYISAIVHDPVPYLPPPPLVPVLPSGRSWVAVIG